MPVLLVALLFKNFLNRYLLMPVCGPGQWHRCHF